MDKRKQGIALFITLMVIASIMSIIAVSFTYLEKVQKDAGTTSSIIQGDLLYNNTMAKLKQFFPAKSDNSDKLEQLYLSPLPLTETKSGFSLTISCQPLMIGAPISWLDESLTNQVPEKTRLAKDVLQNIMELYEIEEPNSLEELLIQEVTGRYSQSEEYTPRVKPQKGIVSKRQFEKIIMNYALLYDDTKAIKVPWDKYFTFIKVNNSTKIDGNYLSAEFISAAFDVPIEIVQEDWIAGQSTLSSFLRDNSIAQPNNMKKIYSNKALNAMHCEQIYAYKDRHYGFNFDYIEGRSNNFEFNGQEQ